MAQKRKSYDKQFKIAAARVVLGGEMKAVDLARKLGTKDSTLGGGHRSAERWAKARSWTPRPTSCVRRPHSRNGLSRHPPPQQKPLLGACPLHAKPTELSPRLLWGCFINDLSSIPNRRFHNTSGFSRLLRIAALMASLAAFGRTFEANRFA